MNRYAAGGLLALAAAVMWIGSAANDKKVDTLGPPPAVVPAPCPDCKPDKKPKPWGTMEAMPVGIEPVEPGVAMDIPMFGRRFYRNPDGCIAFDTPIDTPKGMVDICLLVPEKHAVYYHAADGTTKSTHNYKVFKTKTVKMLLRLATDAGIVMLTADHKVAVLDDPDDSEGSYRWVEAGKLNLNEVDYPDGIDVWDITVNEKCFGGEGNFIANGMYVHNSCVQCSIGMTGFANNNPNASTLLWDGPWGKAERGGSYPGRVAAYAAKRGLEIYNITGTSETDGTIPWMKWACATGRGAAIGYASSHFQTLIAHDQKTNTWKVVDNNGDHHTTTYSDAEFRRLHAASGHWAVIVCGPPSPSRPAYRQWWTK